MPGFLNFLFKTLVTILLFPLSIGAVYALARVLTAPQARNTAYFWYLAGGTLAYPVLQIFIPKPMWIYTLAHEVTHAITSILFGGKVLSMKVTARGGKVVVTKSNFLVALAPYVFPFYAAILMLLWYILTLTYGPEVGLYYHWFLLVLGLLTGFHLTLTWYAISLGQTDLKQTGVMFSLFFVLFTNCVFIVLIMKAAAPGSVDTKTFFTDLAAFQGTFWVYAYIYAIKLWQYIILLTRSLTQ
ncbi:MAG: hypothetical protein WC955_00395 [Elusimicrobiota bacterium]